MYLIMRKDYIRLSFGKTSHPWVTSKSIDSEIGLRNSFYKIDIKIEENKIDQVEYIIVLALQLKYEMILYMEANKLN